MTEGTRVGKQGWSELKDVMWYKKVLRNGTECAGRWRYRKGRRSGPFVDAEKVPGHLTFKGLSSLVSKQVSTT